MNLYDEFFSIIEAFEENNITYAVIGGISMAIHDKPRFTEDIDILIKEDDLEKGEGLLGELDFFKSTDPHYFLKTDLVLHRFVKTKKDDYLVLDLLSGEDENFSCYFDNAISHEWEKGVVTVVSREDLIRLKKARNSDQDKVDIKNLEEDEEKD